MKISRTSAKAQSDERAAKTLSELMVAAAIRQKTTVEKALRESMVASATRFAIASTADPRVAAKRLRSDGR
jgi:hypothetical protein